MKKLLFKSLMIMGAMLATVTGFTSCGGGGDDEPEPATLTVSNSSLITDANGGSMSFQVTSNTAWSISGYPSWISVSPSTGKSGTTNVSITAASNTSVDSRNCTLMVSTTDGSLASNIQVVQSGLQISLSATQSVNVGSEKGAINTFAITSNVAWTLSGVPEWLSATPLNGSGNATVTLTTLSTNETAEERTANLIVTAGNQTATVKVSQPSVYANCSVEAANELILSNGYYADLKFSSNVLGYVEAMFTASVEKKYTSQELYAVTLEGTNYSAEDQDYTMWHGMTANTDYAYCVIPYISSSEGKREYGPMTIVHFTTKSSSTYCDASVTTSYTSSTWRYSTSMGKRCHHYWLLYSTGSYAYNYYNASDTYLAYVMRYQIENKEGYDYAINNRTVSVSRESGDNYFFVWTWGVDDNGEFSGNICSSYKSVSSSYSMPSGNAENPTPVNRMGRKKLNSIAKSFAIENILR